MFNLVIPYLTTSNLPWFMDLTFQLLCNIVLTAANFTFTTRHIHNWALFLLWLSLFIPCGAISSLFSSSILGTYQPGEFIFQYHIFFSFHTIHGVLKARILKWFAIPFSVDHILSELSTMTCPSWMTLHGMAHNFIELDKSVIHVIILGLFSVIAVFVLEAVGL